MPRSFPADLAKHVHLQLTAREKKAPTLSVLTRLFETLYFASLKREENQPIACRIAFMSRRRPDPYPPERILPDRWRHFPLGEELPFNVRNLVKLSTAVDPWGSTLAVDADSEGKLHIWGLIDQSVRYSTYIVKEASSGPELPGMFQAVIHGTGEIAVYKTYVLLGGLRQDTLVKRQLRVFQSGPIHSKLMKSIRAFQRRIRKTVGSSVYNERDHWDVSLEDMWMSALCRILISIQRYRHGGAVLISDSSVGLNAKYLLDYGRLADALSRQSLLTIGKTFYSDRIYEDYLDEEAEFMPVGLYLDDDVTGTDLIDTNNEVTGCVRFLASLSRVDGLIWLDHSLRLKGFGVEITVREEPSRVFRAEDSQGSRLKRLDPNHFGTRHRSMFRFCAAEPSSIGFVISQDGDVRGITKVEKRVILWDNVRIQSLHNARSVSG